MKWPGVGRIRDVLLRYGYAAFSVGYWEDAAPIITEY